MRHANRAHAQPGQQIALGRADEQHAVFTGQAHEQLEHLLLGGLIEINQQIAAEHEVIGRLAGQQTRVQHVTRLKTNLLAHVLTDPMAVGLRAEMPIPESDLLTAKRIFAVHRALGLVDRPRADIDRIHHKLPCRKAGIEQRHGNRVRFFAGRAWQAEKAQWPRIHQFRQARRRELAQGQKGFGVPKKPGFGNDHRFDQRQLLIDRVLQQQPIAVAVLCARRRATLAHCALDDGLAHRIDVQPDTVLEERKKTRVGAHGASSNSDRLQGCSGYSSSRTGSLSRS